MKEDELKVIEMALQILYQSVDNLEQFNGFYGDVIKNEIYSTAQHLGKILDYDFNI